MGLREFSGKGAGVGMWLGCGFGVGEQPLDICCCLCDCAHVTHWACCKLVAAAQTYANGCSLKSVLPVPA